MRTSTKTSTDHILMVFTNYLAVVSLGLILDISASPHAAIKRIHYLEANKTVYEEVLTKPILAIGAIEKYLSLQDNIGEGKLKQRIRDMVLTERHDTPIFYNLFVSSPNDIPRVQALVEEQLATALNKHPVFVDSIGTPLPLPKTVLHSHHSSGSELITLTTLWNYCRANRNTNVIYLHSKGSFHAHHNNDLLRLFLTRGALSEECANLPNTCNVCSSRMSPIPHPHTSGNMWLARCEYISKLLAPRTFAVDMNRRVGHESPCRGSGRYAAEHWIYSHPSAKPCDLSTDAAYVWNYDLIPQGNFDMKLQPAPRFALSMYVKNNVCGSDGQSLQERIDEYRALYNAEPANNWWGRGVFKSHSPY